MAAAGVFFFQPTPALASPGDEWVMPGGSALHDGFVRRPLPQCGLGAWHLREDETGATIRFIPYAGLAVSGQDLGACVYAVGRVSRAGGPANEPRLFAVSRDKGEVQWSQPVPTPTFNSWASPVLDVDRGAVLVASDRRISCFDAKSGDPRWQTVLQRVTVNTSPVITQDLGHANRLFITDYQGGGTAGRLYCINIDEFDATLNPFTPGQIVWSVSIGGSSGNTPAYLDGVVYVASNGTYRTPPQTNSPGNISAYPATAVTAPSPIWTYFNVIAEGFYGGVSVRRGDYPGDAPRVYAATYAFSDSGLLSSSNLVRVNGLTGALVWSVPTGRTASMPVLLPDGRILLSAGVRGDGFRSAASLSLFQDVGTSAELEWDSALATWTDTDEDGTIDEGEYTPRGGWTLQPVVAQWAGKNYAIVGVIPDGSLASPEELQVIDLSKVPSQGCFELTHIEGPGNSAALAGSNLYATGEEGLYAFGPTLTQLDVNLDLTASIDDLYAWEAGDGERDINLDGVVDASDRALLLTSLRPSPTSLVEGMP